ncbi:MAG: YeeE/YedE family protein [Myxococcales bacterium]|jgi:hypothetical protein|nr:YeeE/YedE family protein [Deltaproteobacteria bacterium]NOQ83285.1 YeeE/YedE family protein [Myxococcales bacterium]
MNPYLAGVGLGLVLLLAFVVMGRGLGASGAFSTIVAVLVDAVAPEHARANDFYVGYLENGYGSPFKSFLMFEVIGVLVGGFISGSLAGRVKRTIERGPRMSAKGRIALAILGGTMMGFGAKLAGGCTSGQGLSGGAVLGLGSWTFMIMVFVGGYAGAYFLRREWR